MTQSNNFDALENEFLTLHARTNTRWVQIFVRHLRTAASEALRDDLKMVLRFRLNERRWARHRLLGRSACGQEI